MKQFNFLSEFNKNYQNPLTRKMMFSITKEIEIKLDSILGKRLPAKAGSFAAGGLARDF
jgi:hypothetical protein